MFHSLFPFLSSFLRWVVVEKVNAFCAWCISTFYSTLCFVSFKLPLFAQISQAIAGEIFPHSPATASSHWEEVERQVWHEELVLWFKRELISAFKSTQYTIIYFIYTWNVLQQLVLIGLPEFSCNIEASECERNKFLLQVYFCKPGREKAHSWSCCELPCYGDNPLLCILLSCVAGLNVFITNTRILMSSIKPVFDVWNIF